MEKEDEYSDLIESTGKPAFRIQIPYSLRFSIIWTLFFSVIGLILQIIQSPAFAFGQSFSNFFGSNYLNWFKTFLEFFNITEYNTGMSIFSSIMSQWYYFFYTAGLLFLIWGLISWIINFEIVFKKNVKPRKIINETPRQMQVQQRVQEEASEIEESPEDTDRISNWLEEGDILLGMGKVKEAEEIYQKLQAHYDSRDDFERFEYKRILDFYYKILEKKR